MFEGICEQSDLSGVSCGPYDDLQVDENNIYKEVAMAISSVSCVRGKDHHYVDEGFGYEMLFVCRIVCGTYFGVLPLTLCYGVFELYVCVWY